MVARSNLYLQTLARIVEHPDEANITTREIPAPLGRCYYPRHCTSEELLRVGVIFSAGDGRDSEHYFHFGCYQRLLADYRNQREHPLRLVS